MRVGTIAIAIAAAAACSENRPGTQAPGSPDATPPQAQVDSSPPQTASGSFDLLTYNVAGLPQGISGSDPAQNTSKISPLLNQYDWVVVQEDFAYHDDLASSATHPHQSEPMQTSSPLDMGDGLNRFATAPFEEFAREAWLECNGLLGDANDCLTEKGFSFARHTVAPGIEIDLYNLHMDAGRDANDIAARQAQVQQLLTAIASLSADRAIIVAGDTNMKDDDEAVLQMLLSGAELSDACRSLSCPEPMRIDRVMFRSSSAVELGVADWRVDESFVDAGGDPLSDHEAVGVHVSWSER